MHRFGIFLFFLFSLISYTPAQAGILIEPYVGYGSGTYASSFKTSTTTYDTTTSGAMYGGRLGLSFLGLWLAADYTSTSPSVTFAKPADTSKGSAISNMAFIDAGFDFPFLFRFWGGYGVSNYQKINYQSSAGLPMEVKFKGGSAVKAGLGFKLAYFFSVNFEYIKPTYTKYEVITDGVSAGEADVDTDFSELKQDMYSVSISFPLNLL